MTRDLGRQVENELRGTVEAALREQPMTPELTALRAIANTVGRIERNMVVHPQPSTPPALTDQINRVARHLVGRGYRTREVGEAIAAALADHGRRHCIDIIHDGAEWRYGPSRADQAVGGDNDAGAEAPAELCDGDCGTPPG